MFKIGPLKLKSDKSVIGNSGLSGYEGMLKNCRNIASMFGTSKGLGFKTKWVKTKHRGKFNQQLGAFGVWRHDKNEGEIILLFSRSAAVQDKWGVIYWL